MSSNTITTAAAAAAATPRIAPRTDLAYRPLPESVPQSLIASLLTLPAALIVAVMLLVHAAVADLGAMGPPCWSRTVVETAVISGVAVLCKRLLQREPGAGEGERAQRGSGEEEWVEQWDGEREGEGEGFGPGEEFRDGRVPDSPFAF